MENPSSFCPSGGTLRPLSGQAECKGELVALVAILFFILVESCTHSYRYVWAFEINNVIVWNPSLRQPHCIFSGRIEYGVLHP